MISGYWLIGALAAAVALLFLTRSKRKTVVNPTDPSTRPSDLYEDLPESNTCCMSPEFAVDSVDALPDCPTVVNAQEFQEEPGKVDDEPILSDTADLSGLAGYDQMKNEESQKGTRVLIIDDGRANIAAALSKIVDQGPFVTIEDHGDTISKAMVALDPKEVPVEEPVLAGTNDALRNLRQAIMLKVVKKLAKPSLMKKDEHWLWSGKTFTFRKQNVRRVLWNWLSRVPSASSIKFGPDSESEVDILLDNEVLKTVCGASKCIRPDHQKKVTRRSIADYKKP